MRPETKAIVDRVWAGRYQLRELAVDPHLRNVKIVVGIDIWIALLVEQRDQELEGILYRNYCAIETGGPEFRMFGIPIERSNELGFTDIRFRSEVSV